MIRERYPDIGENRKNHDCEYDQRRGLTVTAGRTYLADM